MVFGHSGTASMHDMGADSKLLTVIPNVLELGRNDHVLHIIIGLVFVVAALMGRRLPRTLAAGPPMP